MLAAAWATGNVRENKPDSWAQAGSTKPRDKSKVRREANVTALVAAAQQKIAEREQKLANLPRSVKTSSASPDSDDEDINPVDEGVQDAVQQVQKALFNHSCWSTSVSMHFCNLLPLSCCSNPLVGRHIYMPPYACLRADIFVLMSTNAVGQGRGTCKGGRQGGSCSQEGHRRWNK